MREYYSSVGTFNILPVDMKRLRNTTLSEWRENNAPPSPPLKEPRYYRENRDEMQALRKELGVSRGDAIKEWRKRQPRVPNTDDKEYIEEVRKHTKKEVLFLTNEVVVRGVVADGTHSFWECLDRKMPISQEFWVIFDKLRKIPKEVQGLYFAIIDISELTERLVIEKVKDMGYLWRQIPLLDVVQSGGIPKGNVSSTWNALGSIAAKEVEGIGPYKFRNLEIVEQAEIVAVYLTQSWISALNYEDQRQKSEMKRKNKR